MNSIELMMEEHKHIKRMLGVMRKYCYKVLKNETVDYNDFFKMIDFVRNYADKHHHGKEEMLLFEKMVEELDATAEKLVNVGMMVEHDLGRLHMKELEEALERVIVGDDESKLDVIANAISYTHLLYRHIDKEDKLVYKYGEKNLSKETLEYLDVESNKLEEEATAKGIQEKYLTLIDELEGKL
ncbi:MAG: hemerythrin domain-containing protein [Clostridiaceae bacterium]|nr:hemerythrin domain-containing protein [Clostridiaceae bacterium]